MKTKVQIPNTSGVNNVNAVCSFPLSVLSLLCQEHSLRSKHAPFLKFPVNVIALIQRSMTGKRVGILTEFNYEDMELWYPYYRLLEEGHTVFTIGPEKGKTYNSKHGYPCKAEYGIDEIEVSTTTHNRHNLDIVYIYYSTFDSVYDWLMILFRFQPE